MLDQFNTVIRLDDLLAAITQRAVAQHEAATACDPDCCTTLLVDNQLPLTLTRYLATRGRECTNVQDVGLERAGDRTILQYANERGLTTVTKYEDFQALAHRQAGIPPQVVWVRLGNCGKAD